MSKVLVPLAQGCEELEAVTIIDILRRAGISVVSAGLIPGPVKASRGVMLLPDAVLDEVLAEDFDMIVLPGGMPGSEHLKNHAGLRMKMQQMSDKGWLAAICAAPMALHAAGVLEGRRATSFPGVLDALPGRHVYSEEPVVVDGRVVTSKGPGTAMDFALTLVALLTDEATRHRVESALQRSQS